MILQVCNALTPLDEENRDLEVFYHSQRFITIFAMQEADTSVENNNKKNSAFEINEKCCSLSFVLTFLGLCPVSCLSLEKLRGDSQQGRDLATSGPSLIPALWNATLLFQLLKLK